jgi:3-phosphoshikimate 1-carboxyvinyltransferase
MIIRPAAQVRGRLQIPGDKSISHRAALIAALAEGASRIDNYSTSADCRSTLACLRQMGIVIEQSQNIMVIHGRGLKGLREPAGALDCGNSGTTIRLLAGILASQNFSSILTGDDSLRARPMQRIIEPLKMMGAEVSAQAGTAPLAIERRDHLQPIEYELLVPSAQVKSCILLAGLQADGQTKVIEKQITRDHTERMLSWFGAEITTSPAEQKGAGARFATVTGPAQFKARDVSIPGDLSSAAYFTAAAALLPGSELEIVDAGLNPTRDQFLKKLVSFGANISRQNETDESNEPRGTVLIKNHGPLKASPGENLINGVAIAQLIDELPLLAVVGSQLEGGLEIREAKELRVKESDRINATVTNLRGMGAQVEEFPDGLRVTGPVSLRGARIDPRGDHRIAMAFAVAALMAEGDSEIENADCVAVSFPEFFDLLDSVVVR